MLTPKIFPESTYSVDECMTYETLQKFYESGLTVAGKALRFDEANQLIEVNLGGGIIGKLPISETTIYPIFKADGSISPYIFTIIGNIIRVKIKSLKSDNIILSRKENMLDALENIRKNSEKITKAGILGFSKLNVFLDVGEGIQGKIYITNLIPVMVDHIKDLELELNSIIPIKILGFKEELQKFEASHSLTIPPVENVLSEGDVVLGKVFNVVSNSSGYAHFVLIKNSYAGILDDPKKILKYGDIVVVFIKKIKEDNKLKLTFVKKI